VNALIEGLYKENTSLQQLREKGDFGIGTFNELDGEMVLLDGVFHQLRADGRAYTVDDTVQTPFACVTFYRPDAVDEVDGDYEYAAFQRLLELCTPSPNMLYAIRVDGLFRRVRTRSVPRQETYRPLVEVTRNQPEFELEDVEGTIVGFYNPPFISSVNVPGYHLHFLSRDGSFGGHLLHAHLVRGRIGVQHAATMELGLPVTVDYMTADLTRDISADVEEVER
jgi:acetolactate decarboxylase